MAQQIPKENLLDDLVEFAEELGECPTFRDMKEKGPHSGGVYQSRFGSWNNALREAGLGTNKEHRDNSDAVWTEKETLKKLYWEKELSTYDIADRFDTHANTVYRWLLRHGIETRSDIGRSKKQTDYYDEDWLREQYLHKERSISEIAHLAGISPALILKRLERYQIPRRKRAGNSPPSLNVNTSGYEYFRSIHNGETDTVQHHQLLAIAKGEDPHTVFDPNYVVHHKKNIPWLNYQDNVELMTISDHIKLHCERGDW